MAAQVEAHENAIALYQNYIAQGTDEQAKAYAAKYLPRIIGHTNMIYQVARQVGAPGIEKRPESLPGGVSMSDMMNGM